MASTIPPDCKFDNDWRGSVSRPNGSLFALRELLQHRLREFDEGASNTACVAGVDEVDEVDDVELMSVWGPKTYPNLKRDSDRIFVPHTHSPHRGQPACAPRRQVRMID